VTTHETRPRGRAPPIAILPGGAFFKGHVHITVEWYRPYFTARCSINIQKSDANHFFEEIRFDLWFV